ncbi:MAG: SGNH/GDSL hydrolase family protein [Acidobacteriota bacterium]|nr:SGNH/GDSL hydrolase family protein [Acidobacteriota bacterium]
MLRKLILVLVSSLAALLGAEGLLRVMHAAPDVGIIHRGRFRLSANPKIGFEPVPGFVYHGPQRSFIDYEGASNALGYRDVDHQVKKPDGAYRIVVIGDSVGSGLKVERFEDTFPPLVERLLREAGISSEVINLSVSGYNTQQEVETLREHGLEYAPDLVLVAYTLGDRERVDGGIMETLLAEKSAELGHRALDPYLMESAIYRFLRFRVLAGGQHAAVPDGPPPRVPAADAETTTALALVSGDTVDQYLGKLKELSQEHHFEVLLTIFPYYPKNFRNYKRGDQHVFARGEGQKYGFHVLDLLETMARCRQGSTEPINADNFHPSAAGHRCAAEAMVKLIRAEIVHR